MILPNIYLHVVGPRMMDVTIPTSNFGKRMGAPQKFETRPLESISLTQVHKVNQTILNGGAAVGERNPLHPVIMSAVEPRINQIKDNIQTMENALYEGGRVS